MKKNLAVIAVSFFFATTIHADVSIPDWAEGSVECTAEVGIPSKKKLYGELSPAESIQRKGYLSEARSWIKSAREAATHEDVSYSICAALQYAYAGNFAPEDLHTSAEDLRELQIQGWRSEAVSWYNYAKEGAGNQDVSYHISRAREYALRALEAQ